jgi:hypothetical protein
MVSGLVYAKGADIAAATAGGMTVVYFSSYFTAQARVQAVFPANRSIMFQQPST